MTQDISDEAVERFSASASYTGIMKPSRDGLWVQYHDYAAIVAQLKAVIEDRCELQNQLDSERFTVECREKRIVQLSARLKEVEEERDVQNDLRQIAEDAADEWRSRAETAEAKLAIAENALTEMTRRRDEWKKKADGYDEVRLALREKVGAHWPPHMSRVLWAGIAADEKKRADDAEAKLAIAKAALQSIVDGEVI